MRRLTSSCLGMVKGSGTKDPTEPTRENFHDLGREDVKTCWSDRPEGWEARSCDLLESRRKRCEMKLCLAADESSQVDDECLAAEEPNEMEDHSTADESSVVDGRSTCE
mmetsp:Transcript_64863/g.211387  ORF Transcript_64863/g.211387 Transcript_64863/m.211387 type:complete len:109 (+) Transcript_64863:174-500(+)